MKLLKYLDFITEAREETLLPSIFMRDFINQLEKIDSPICTEFKKLTNRMNPLFRQPHKWTFIATDDTGEKVIFSEYRIYRNIRFLW